MVRKLTAEFVGAFTLIFIGAGSVVVAIGLGGGLGGGGLVTIALAHGLAIATMVSAVGHISGGHFNPAISIAAWVVQRMKLAETVLYVIAQLAGAVAAAVVLRLALPEELWRSVSLGTPQVIQGFSDGRAVLIEAVLTFFLVWVVFATAMDPEGSFGKIAGLGIGFVIAMDIMVGAPFTGAAMNPARSLGPALVGGYFTGWWVYWVGPLVGGALAALLYETVILRTPRAKEAALAEPASPPPE